MISTTVQSRTHVYRQAVKLARSANLALAGSPLGLRLACVGPAQHHHIIASPRPFSTTPKNHLRDFFPAKDTPHIQTTKAAWPHPGYTLEEMVAVEPAHREPRNFSDWAAWKIVRFARFWMDKATGMGRDQQVDKKHPTTSVVAEKPLTEAQWVCTHSHIKKEKKNQRSEDPPRRHGLQTSKSYSSYC
ncbi:inducible alternative oxidase 2 [Metarhizium acridum]|uniref:inducible alternative oxidase 2 n=1 Tax=Metarhizium acridum TaxID=92637 RepID=UPI001C6C8589|nr:inducible alternative oxidase 2 [Metarhizium acridum]